MFIGRIENYLVPVGMANTVIPIRTETNTNDRVVNNKGVISFLESGNYNVDASISVSADSIQNVNVSIFTDDGVRKSVLATIPTSPSDTELGTANVALIDAIKVALTKYFSIANIYIGVDQSGVIVNGYIRIEHFK